MSTSVVVHWGGGATIRTKTSTIRWAHGFPCCCVGDQAIRIARDGRQTFELAAVTCRRCLQAINRDASLARHDKPAAKPQEG